MGVSVRGRWRVVLALAATAAVLAAVVAVGSTRRARAAADLRGEEVEVLAVWSGGEADRFEAVLQRFEEDTGAAVRYTSTDGRDVAAVLEERVAAGHRPDLVVLPQPGLLRTYAASGRIQPVGDVVGDLVRVHYSPVWQRLGSVDGELYGVWFKAAHKSLVWYSIAAFERAGVVPPDDLDGLLQVARRVTDVGVPAFAVAGADAWTLTDLFENLYLRVAGPQRYDDLADRRLPWTDPSVHAALRRLAELLQPAMVAGGPAEALATDFPAAVAAVAAPEPRAAMVVEGDFVAGMVGASSPGAVGIDVDVFPFPEVDGRRLVVSGGDVAVLLGRSPAGDALLRFLATPQAAAVWAALGGFLSPNEDVDLEAYADHRARAVARTLLEAGDEVHFDLSDLQPAAFGATSGQGMLGILQAFLADPGDVAATAERLEAAAAAAYAAPPAVGSGLGTSP